MVTLRSIPAQSIEYVTTILIHTGALSYGHPQISIQAQSIGYVTTILSHTGALSYGHSQKNLSPITTIMLHTGALSYGHSVVFKVTRCANRPFLSSEYKTSCTNLFMKQLVI